MKKLLIALLLLASGPAWAQEKATAVRCNAAANGNIALNGNTVVVTSPTLGGIYICGYALSAAGQALSATIGFGTAATGASFTSLTQAWALSPTLAFGNPAAYDESSAYRGLYVPPGNALLINQSTTATMGYTIYYFQENTNR